MSLTNNIDIGKANLQELRRLKNKLEELISVSGGGSGAATEAKQDNIITLEEYQAWDFIPGNSKVLVYYAGVEVDNPSGNTANVKTITFLTGATTVVTQTITYDSNDNVLTITAS